MREFANITEEDKNDLESLLSDRMLHIYKNRILPSSCSKQTARIGIEKHPENHIEKYKLYIDEDITANTSNADFNRWLERGELSFLSIDDLAEFLRSLMPLFIQETELVPQNTTVDPTAAGTSVIDRAHDDIVDKNKVEEITNAAVTRKPVWPEEIAEPLKMKIFGQELAINSLAEAISMNLMRKNSKILVVAFMGPPGVGKSETGRSLAEVMTNVTGKQYGFINLFGSQYEEEHTIHTFLGSPPSYVGHRDPTAFDPVRNNPCHVILIDEIEKAHPKVLIALMEAMDTSTLMLADNTAPIDLSHCILIFTSNLPIDVQKYKEASVYERDEMCKDVFTKHCQRPEISRRIREFMVFTDLSSTARVDVVIKFAKQALDNYDAVLKHIDEHLIVEFLKLETKYGASEIGNYVEKAISRKIIESKQADLVRGKYISINGPLKEISFDIDEIPDGLRQEAAAAPESTASEPVEIPKPQLDTNPTAA